MVLSRQRVDGEDGSQKAGARRKLRQPQLDTGHCLDPGPASDWVFSPQIASGGGWKAAVAQQVFNGPLWTEVVASFTPKNKWVEREISFSGELTRKQG